MFLSLSGSKVTPSSTTTTSRSTRRSGSSILPPFLTNFDTSTELSESVIVERSFSSSDAYDDVDVFIPEGHQDVEEELLDEKEDLLT
jgi:hypothetical protein